MIADIWTIVWKEWKEFLVASGGRRSNLMRQFLLVFVFGVFLPLQMGRAWVISPVVLATWSWVPMLLVSTMVADAFAGERERHTLETLLSTRMPDRPILYGKVLAAVAYGWGVTLVSVILGLIVVNVAHGQGEILLYPPLVAVAGVVLSLLIAGLAASSGVLISLRAATVRQAAQTMSMVSMAVWLAPLLGGTLLSKVLPQGAPALAALALGAVNWPLVLLVVAALLAAVDLGLLAIAAARFRRSRLISD